MARFESDHITLGQAGFHGTSWWETSINLINNQEAIANGIGVVDEADEEFYNATQCHDGRSDGGGKANGGTDDDDLKISWTIDAMLCHSVCRIAYEDYKGLDNLKMLIVTP